MTIASDRLGAEVLIDVRGVSKCHQIYDRPQDRLLQSLYKGRRQLFREFWALRDINFQLKRGDAVGIVGRNGAGKSTLLQIITGTLSPTAGEVTVKGRVAALLQLGSGFNPEFTGRENVYLNGAILGVSRSQIEHKFSEITSFAEIGDFIDQPVKNYSSGMVMRLAFAVSTCLDPDILIVDEALAVGDALFQRKCYARLDDFVEGGGTLLFVSHSLETVKRVCNRAIYLKDGLVRVIGAPSTVVSTYEFDLDESSKAVRSAAPAHEPPHAVVTNYGNREAEITDAWTENAAGERVSVIKAGEPFAWCYSVRFHASLERVTFGMKIVNTEGLILFGTNSEMISADVHFAVGEGDRKVVRFTMSRNLLAPGDYFLSAGVSKLDKGNDTFLHRRVDVAGLRIISDGLPAYAGMFDLQAELRVQ